MKNRLLRLCSILAAVSILFTVIGACNIFGDESKPTVSVVNPANNKTGTVGKPLFIQSVAVDSTGLDRIELWIDGELVDTKVAPDRLATFTADQLWTPTIPGSHVIELRAFNANNVQNDPLFLTVVIQEEAAVAAMTPTPPIPTDLEGTSEQNSAAQFQPEDAAAPEVQPAANTPLVTATTNLNVRTGPGTNYPYTGALFAGQSAEIIGRNQDGSWWQIAFPGAPEGKGWVSAASQFSTAHNTDGIPIAQAPPPPTDTPTPIPPTDTPTPTPSATPTRTPRVTRTPRATPANPSTTELTTTLTQTATLRAPFDSDSLNNPALSAEFSPTGRRNLIHNSDVSSPQGDLDDWVEFRTIISDDQKADIWVTFSCRGDDESLEWLRARLWDNGTEVAGGPNIVCGDEDRQLTLNANHTYYLRIHFSKDGAYYADYDFKVVGVK